MANPNDFRPCSVCDAQLHYTEGICPYCPEPACVECGETEDVVGKIDEEGWCGRCTASAELELAREYAADAKRYYNEDVGAVVVEDRQSADSNAYRTSEKEVTPDALRNAYRILSQVEHENRRAMALVNELSPNPPKWAWVMLRASWKAVEDAKAEEGRLLDLCREAYRLNAEDGEGDNAADRTLRVPK